jgi:glucose-1-phosphate cytidylyltransferase
LRQDLTKEDWVVQLVDTGLTTNTGGRMKRLADRVGNETFMMTYGDGVSNVDLTAVYRFHRKHGKLATVTAVHPPARFGELDIAGDARVMHFAEKPQVREGWINGGFFVLEPKVLEYIDDDDISWQAEPMERLAKEGQLMAYRHDGFWQCMDTVRDVEMLQGLWRDAKAPWKVW